MLRLEDALQRVLNTVQPMGVVEVPLGESHGRILAEDVVAPLAIPPWDNSAMDGYAVLASDFPEGQDAPGCSRAYFRVEFATEDLQRSARSR